MQALDVLEMIKELNPKVKHLIENVRFKEKHPNTYKYFCQRIGHEPIVTDAKDMSCVNRKRYFWTNIPQSDHPQQTVPANQFIESNANLVDDRVTAPCAMASWRCEQCNNRHEPYCEDGHNHAHHHYMYTGNPIRIQESGSYHGQRPSKPFLPSQLASIGQRHVRADELEGFLGLKQHYTRVGKLADGSLIVVDSIVFHGQ